MANIQALPQELFDSIFKHCSRNDLRACHLTSRILYQAVRPQLFWEIHLSLDHRSWENAQCILADEELRSSVQELILHSSLLPEFTDDKLWLWHHCMDVRPFRGEFYYDIMTPEQRETWMHNDYAENEWLHDLLSDRYDELPRWPNDIQAVCDDYFATMESQKAFFDSPEFFDAFRAFVRSFPRLHRLRDAPWYNDWFRPPYVHCDGTLNKVSWYLDMLKPKEHVMFKTEDLEEAWEGAPVAQSFLLRAGTFTSRLFLHAADCLRSDVEGTNHISEVDMALTLYPLEKQEHILTAFGMRIQNYGDVWQPYLSGFSTNNAAYLRTLRLTLLSGECASELKITLKYICALTNTARSLTSLSLHFRTTNNDFDFLEPLDTCKVLHLQAFDLDGAVITEHSLRTFLRNHATTLRKLSLNDVRIQARQGTWSSIFRALPSFLSLQTLEAECLINPGLGPGSNQSSFLGPDRISLLALQAYVCKEGPWLGLTSSVVESGDGKVRLSAKDDSGWDWSRRSWPMNLINSTTDTFTTEIRQDSRMMC